MDKIQLHPQSRILAEVAPMTKNNERAYKAARAAVNNLDPMVLTPEQHSTNVRLVVLAINRVIG